MDDPKSAACDVTGKLWIDMRFYSTNFEYFPLCSWLCSLCWERLSQSCCAL